MYELATYFAQEKTSSLVFISVGALALAVSAYLSVTASPYQSAGYPLAFVACIQIVVGATVYFRTDGQVAALTATLLEDPAAFRLAELERMGIVMRSFGVYKLMEIIALVVGAAVVIVCRGNNLWWPIGAGLAAQAALLLVLDYFAQGRAERYLSFVMAQ